MSRFGCGKQNRELLLTPVDRLDTMRRWFQSGGEAARPPLDTAAHERTANISRCGIVLGAPF